MSADVIDFPRTATTPPRTATIPPSSILERIHLKIDAIAWEEEKALMVLELLVDNILKRLGAGE